MSILQLNVDTFPFGLDNTQRRLISAGTIQILPDQNASGAFLTTYTYTTGGLRCRFRPLEVMKVNTLLPQWVEFEPWVTWQYTYTWSPGYAVTNLQVASGVLTVTTNNTFQVGDSVKLERLLNAVSYPSSSQTDRLGILAPLNNYSVTVASVIGTTPQLTGFTANVNLPNIASTTCTGLAVGVGKGVGPTPHNQGMVSGEQWQGVVKLYYSAITSGTGMPGAGQHGMQMLPGPVDVNAIQDVVGFRAESMRTYF